MELYKRFSQFETHTKLSKFNINGFWYYPIFKVHIYFSTIQNQIRKTTSENDESLKVLSFLFRSIKWMFYSKSVNEPKIMFVDHANSKRENFLGNVENIYFEPLIKMLLPLEMIFFEFPSYNYGHIKNTSSIPSLYPDLAVFKVLSMVRFRKKKFYNLDLKPLEELFDYFDINFDKLFIYERLNKFLIYEKYFLKLLQKLRPKIIILIDSYTYVHMALIAAAKVLAIPIIEFQHGIINKKHWPYMYKSVVDRDLFPDYFFSFGSYFSNILKYNSKQFLPEKIFDIGFPLLDSYENKQIHLPANLIKLSSKHKIIYVTSQWTIRSELFYFLQKLLQELPHDYYVLIKPHPGEKNVNMFYQQIESFKNVSILKNRNINSLQIMKIAYVHVTVYSTSFLESFFMGVPTIFVYIEKMSDSILEFVDNKTTFLVKTPEEFIQKISFLSTNMKYIKKQLVKLSQKYYCKNSLENMTKKIKEILNLSK